MCLALGCSFLHGEIYMSRHFHFIPAAFRVLSLTFALAGIAVVTSHASIVSGSGASDRMLSEPSKPGTAKLADSETVATYQWNVNDRELPLLVLDDDHLQP